MGVTTLATLPVAAAELARRATKGPRYTSYPPAPHFKSDFGEDEARAQLAALGPEKDETGISLYIHIPFCKTLCWYCGCNVKITRDQDRGAAYVDTVLKEVALYRDAMPGWHLAELSLGGGSPNFLDAPTLKRLADGVRENFPPCKDAMLGIECDPRETTLDQISALAEFGFGRLSVGVQDFEEVVQKTINRHQSREQTSELIAHARKEGFTSAGVDLVYGLPGQTPDSFSSTVDTVLEIRPDRLALFGYAHLPHIIKHQKLVEREPIPGLDERAELLTTAIEKLCGAGYVRVGFDHFALEHDPLAQAVLANNLHRNFQGFTVPRGGPLLGCGVTGISDAIGAYWQNVTDLKDWAQRVEAGHLPIQRGLSLGDEDKLRRHVIYRLMCDSMLRFTDVEKQFGIDFREHFSYELEALQDVSMQDLVTVSPEEGWIKPSALGFELIRNVCMTFDPHLRGKEPAGSTTI